LRRLAQSTRDCCLRPKAVPMLTTPGTSTKRPKSKRPKRPPYKIRRAKQIVRQQWKDRAYAVSRYLVVKPGTATTSQILAAEGLDDADRKRVVNFDNLSGFIEHYVCDFKPWFEKLDPDNRRAAEIWQESGQRAAIDYMNIIYARRELGL
jgi:hypothetical protein